MSNVKRSLEEIVKSGVEYEFRTTVVPGLHDLDNLKKLAEELEEIFRSLKLEIRDCRWFLQQFSQMNCLDKKYLKLSPYSKKELEAFRQELQKIIPNIFLRGV